MPGARRTARSDCAGAVTGQRYGPGHRPTGAGQLTGVRRRARRASARQGAAGRRPAVVRLPTAPALARGGARCASHAFPGGLALLRPILPGGSERLARRRRALEAVEKVVTGQYVTVPGFHGSCLDLFALPATVRALLA